MALVDSHLFLPITEALLQKDSPATPLSLAKALEITPLQTYRVLQFYKYHRAVSYHRGAPLTVDAKKVLALAVGLRAHRVMPTRVIDHAPPVNEMHLRLKNAGIQHVFGFATAANLLGYFEPTGAASMYVPKGGLQDCLAQLAEGRGQDRVHIFCEPDGLTPKPWRDGELPTTQPIRTLIDLSGDPTGGAHAAFLEQTLRQRGIL